MLRVLLISLVWLSTFASVCPALAGTRVALVIGNSNYAHAPRLINPANDSKLVAETLKQAGFDLVDMRPDLSAAGMRRALRDFGDRAKAADIAVVYYAGHGIEVDGNNYLIPTDAVLERDTDVYDEALSLDRVLVAVEGAKQLRLVILDACRDNPFSRNIKQASSRSIARGLAKIEPNSPNTLIAFSAKAGSTANDGDGDNSPFTSALAKHLATPGLDIRRAFGFVRDDVLKVTDNRQEPYVYGSLGGEDVPLVPAKLVPVTAAPAADQAGSVRADYQLALQVGTPEGWSAFLSQYPTGFYAGLAKAQMNKLAAEQAQRDAADKARAAREEKQRLADRDAPKPDRTRAGQAVAAADQARADAERKRLAATEAAATVEQAARETEAVRVLTPPAAAPQQTASLPPPAPSAEDTKDLTMRLQTELARVGCYDGAANGRWTDTTRSALRSFNREVGGRFDLTAASTAALDGVHDMNGRVCGASPSGNEPKPTVKRRDPAPKASAEKQSNRGRCFVMSGQRFCE